VWGGTYLGTKTMMDLSGPLFFVGVRFAVAAIALAVLFRRALRQIGRMEWLAMVGVGVPMTAAYVFQAAGLEEIESSKAAFITAMHVPMVPVLQLVFMRVAPHGMTWVGVVLCLFGLVLLGEPETPVPSWKGGEVLTIVSTAAIAFEIVMIGVFAPRVNIQAVAILQLAFVSVVAFAGVAVLGEEVPATLPRLFWQVTLVMGMAGALIQFLMNWAQQTVSPTRATLIYSSEPVWAGVVGWFVGERLGGVAVIGCGVILLGVLVGEWRPERWNPTRGSQG
jgi:drug/metabolite transporter (DMT)-like permease